VTGAAPIDASLLPPDVRRAGPQAQRLYEAALGFERVLVSQLTELLARTTGGEGDEDSGAATAVYRELLPGSLADSLQAGGGIGLARELYRSLGGGSGK
jgi:Rod binding domain-containing protein